MITQFQSNLPNVQTEVCLTPSDFQGGQIPSVIRITYQNRFQYSYIFSRRENNGNYCFVLAVAGSFGRKKKKAVVCPTICIIGEAQGGDTTPCSPMRQVLRGAGNGQPYSNQLSATPSGVYTFLITSGSLPTGLTLNPATGEILGTPTVDGNYLFTVTVTDANGCTGVQDFSINVVGN